MSIESVADGMPRCPWAGDDALYRHYHDREWGRPVTSDTRLFEKICLEGFQSGLSWITILRKRERFREVLAHVVRVCPIDPTAVWTTSPA